jgi:hypothetical protein
MELTEGTMKTIENILNEYRNADFETRAYLFLEYRELRSDFIEIDLKDRSKRNRNSYYEEK